MEVQNPEQSSEELKAPANTAADPEEIKPSIEETSQRQQFESQPDPEGFNEELAPKSTTVCALERESKREFDLYETVDEAILEELKVLESSSTTPRVSTSNSSKRKSCGNRKMWAMAGQKMCKCTASCAADCAALCCCPCVLAHLLILGFVKLPSAIAIKAFRYTKRKAGRISRKKKKTDVEEEQNDDESDIDKKARSCKRTWSLSITPHFSGPLVESSPARTAAEEKANNQKFWQDLYAGGHMGFGGGAMERD